ncbi:MAG TPA: hypothetical protein VM074_01480 [Solimonas sp.]|nr:hypothetical protein [Solimonas sp.]
MWSQDFKEFVALLNARGVEYLVVGGYAVGVHGYPRYTGDLDVWVSPVPANAARLVEVLDAFGFAAFGLTAADFTRPERVLQLGQPPFRIDVLTTIDGVSFEACYPRRLEVEFEGLPVSFIGLDDLKCNKRASGRPKDNIDLDELNRLT